MRWRNKPREFRPSFSDPQAKNSVDNARYRE